MHHCGKAPGSTTQRRQIGFEGTVWRQRLPSHELPRVLSAAAPSYVPDMRVRHRAKANFSRSPFAANGHAFSCLPRRNETDYAIEGIFDGV
jgi:hypothetical protein